MKHATSFKRSKTRKRQTEKERQKDRRKRKSTRGFEKFAEQQGWEIIEKSW